MKKPPKDPPDPRDDGLRDSLDPLAAFDLEGEGWMDLLQRAEKPRQGRIGGYEILDEIRHGAQGLVFRARQPGTGRVVALKRLVGGIFSSEDERRRFQREIEVLARLSHPGIVTVHGVEFVDDLPILVMEWVEGRTLVEWAREFCPSERTGLNRKLETFLQVCDAVQFAHQNGVIHRDLKPSNILVDENARCRVLDFGLARGLSDSPLGDPSRTTGFVGTPAYSAPERFREGATPLDVRSDVYSLGIVLFEMLTGSPPFAAKGLTDLLGDIQHRDVPAVSSFAPHANREIDGIVSKATAKAPEARYPTVHAFAEDVRAFLDGRPVRAMPPSWLYHGSRWVRRYRAVFALSVLLLISLITATVMAVAQANEIARERDQAEIARRSAEDQARVAAAQAYRAEAVHSFYMTALKKAAWPYGNQSTDVFDALETAVAGAREHFASVPQVAVALELEVAQTLKVRGRNESAVRLCERALAFEGTLEPRVPLARARLKAILGMALVSLNRPQRAVPHLRAAIELARTEEVERERIEGEVGEWLGFLGHAYYQLGELELAQENYGEALERLERGSDLTNWPRMICGLAGVTEARGRSLEALGILENARRRLEEDPRIEDPLAAISFHLGLFLVKMGREAEGIPLLEEALEAIEGFSVPSPELSYRRYWLASAHQVAGHTEKATRLYDLLARDPRYVASASRGQGIMLEQEGKLEEATEKFLKALEHYPARLVPADVSLADVQRRLLAIYVTQEREDEALAMLDALLAEMRRFAAHGSTLNEGEWREILRGARSIDRYDDALNRLKAIHAVLEERAPTHPEVRKIGVLLAALLE